MTARSPGASTPKTPEILTSPILGGLYVTAQRYVTEVAEKAIREQGQYDLVAGQLHLLRATALQVEALHGEVA